MTRFAWMMIGLATACASVEHSDQDNALRTAEFERIAALEDSRLDGEGELQRFAHSPDANVRARAATALGRLWFPEFGADVTRDLLTLLGDPSADVRAAAAFGLGVRGDPSAADRLVFVALDHHDADPDPLVRARAIEAASKLDRADLRERLLDGFSDSDPRVRLETAQGTARWPTTEANASDVDRRLVDVLTDETDARVVTYTLFALERRKASTALGVFVRFSSSGEIEQRLYAVRGLKALAANPATLGHLWRASTDGDARIVCEALLALGSANDEPSMHYIARASRHSNASVRRCAWEAAATAGARDLANAQHLERAGMSLSATIGSSAPPSEPSSWVRGAMVEAHLRLLAHRASDPSTIEATLEMLAKMYRTFSREERVGAVRGLGALDEEYAVAPLLECIKDPEFVVGETALEMLARFPGPVVRGALHEVMRFNDNGLRLAAVLALAEMPDASDFDALERCYDSSGGDGANEIRFNVLRAASKIGGGRAVDLAIKGLLDANPFVRRVAREELGRLDAAAGERADSIALARSATRPAERADERESQRSVGHERIGSSSERAAHAPTELGASTASNPIVDVMTNRGTLRFELFPAEAPLHVHNFLTLAERDHYDGTLWHRVVPNFVAQGGDYRGDGNGGGTWLGRDQSLRHEISPRKYVRGSLGMPRNDDIDSGGSQIFVTHRSTPHLDGRYTIFGELRDGFDTLDALEVGDRIEDVRRIR